jgi:hypothetical protein
LIRLVLVEGLPKYDRVNEANTLASALDLMTRAYSEKRRNSLKITPHTAGSKLDFLEWLEQDADFLHISAHGGIEKGHSYLNITSGGKVTAEDIVQRDIKAKCVFLNACQTSRNDFADAFFAENKQ